MSEEEARTDIFMRRRKRLKRNVTRLELKIMKRRAAGLIAAVATKKSFRGRSGSRSRML